MTTAFNAAHSPEQAAVLVRVREADRRYRSAAAEAEAARRERIAAVRAARTLGVSEAVVADTLGVTPGRVNQITHSEVAG